MNELNVGDRINDKSHWPALMCRACAYMPSWGIGFFALGDQCPRCGTPRAEASEPNRKEES